MKKWYFGAALLCLALTWAPGVERALAHGGHGDPAPNDSGVSVVTVDGFRVELLTSPRPPRVGNGNKIIAKIVRNGSWEPVRDGKVLIGAAPVRPPDSSSPEKNFSPQSPEPVEPLSLLPAVEMEWAGNYTLVRRLVEQGPYLVRIALLELGGKSYRSPTILEFHLNVAPAPGFTPGLQVLFFLALGIAVVGTGWALVRSRSSPDLKASFDLLEIRWLERFVRWRGFQPALQIPFLVLTVVITLLGLFDIQDGARNLATRLTWILWWPGIIITFILVGRLWCVMCPFGTLNDWGTNLARPRRLIPKPLRGLWLATFLFVLLTWADERLGIIGSPRMTAWLIVVLGAVALASGIFFQRRSFCRYLCPITGLQGLYSMVSPVELRPKQTGRCQQACHQDCYRGNEKGMGCPMFEFPMSMGRNTYCNFCFECVKVCPPDNLALRLRAFGKDLWASRKHWPDESYLALVLVGITTIVTAQMLSTWSPWISQMARLIPLDIRILMKPVTYLALTESVIFFGGSLLLFPLSCLLASWAADQIAGEQGRGLKRTFVHLGIMFVPVGLAMHLAHNVHHLLMEGPGVIPTFQRALSRYTPFSAGEPNWHFVPLFPLEVIYWLQMLLVLGGFISSLFVGFRLATALFDGNEIIGKSFVPFVALSLLFTLVNLYLLSQPMGMRHAP